MKNMEGKRKSLPFTLRLIIEGRTSSLYGFTCRGAKKRPEHNKRPASSKSYRSLCNRIRFSPCGTQRLKTSQCKEMKPEPEGFFLLNKCFIIISHTDMKPDVSQQVHLYNNTLFKHSLYFKVVI